MSKCAYLKAATVRGALGVCKLLGQFLKEGPAAWVLHSRGGGWADKRIWAWRTAQPQADVCGRAVLCCRRWSSLQAEGRSLWSAVGAFSSTGLQNVQQVPIRCPTADAELMLLVWIPQTRCVNY
jgi:hypothetical protein